MTTVPDGDALDSGALTVGYYVNDLVRSIAIAGGGSEAYALDVDRQRVRSWVDGSVTHTDHYDGDGDSPSWTQESASAWTRDIGGIAGDPGGGLRLGDVGYGVCGGSVADGIGAVTDSSAVGHHQATVSGDPKHMGWYTVTVALPSRPDTEAPSASAGPYDRGTNAATRIDTSPIRGMRGSSQRDRRAGQG